MGNVLNRRAESSLEIRVHDLRAEDSATEEFANEAAAGVRAEMAANDYIASSDAGSCQGLQPAKRYYTLEIGPKRIADVAEEFVLSESMQMPSPSPGQSILGRASPLHSPTASMYSEQFSPLPVGGKHKKQTSIRR